MNSNTPEEKSERLIIQFIKELQFNCQPSITKMVAKQCAAICVQEILNLDILKQDDDSITQAYWQSVLTSIQKQ